MPKFVEIAHLKAVDNSLMNSNEHYFDCNPFEKDLEMKLVWFLGNFTR